MFEKTHRVSGPDDGKNIDRRSRILVELQGALVRQTRHRKLLRIGKTLALLVCGSSVLAWYLFTSRGTPAPNDGIAKSDKAVESISDPDPGISSYPEKIVHTNPELLETVLITNRSMAGRSKVQTVSDDELADLIAASSAPFIVARIDNRLVAVPVRDSSRSRSK